MSAECPDTQALCGFVEGRIDDTDREVLEHHLDGCAACRRAIVEVGRAIGETPISATTDHPTSRSTAPASLKLSRYEIRREIATGGMGVVYEGWDPALGRRVALKLIRPDLKTAAATEQLADEARALAKVSHPNVLTVFDVGVEDDSVFIAAEYVEGVTMDKGWPHRARSFRDRVDAYLQAARGLAAIHAAGLTHRDIKPSNILLGTDGRVRITDFGLAVGEGRSVAPAGTPAYMAPEQRSGDAGPAADQFALAVCLTEALLGERVGPGTKASDLEKRASRAWGKTPPPSGLWSALEVALARTASKRHESVEDFIGAIDRAMDGSVRRPSRGPILAWSSAIVSAVGIAGASIWMSTGRSPEVLSASLSMPSAPTVPVPSSTSLTSTTAPPTATPTATPIPMPASSPAATPTTPPGSLAASRRTEAPVENRQTSPAERLQAIGIHALSPPYSITKCEKFVADLSKALDDHGGETPDPKWARIAQYNTAICFAYAGDCKRTATLMVGAWPSSPDRDEKFEKWMRQLHPNCATFGD